MSDQHEHFHKNISIFEQRAEHKYMLGAKEYPTPLWGYTDSELLQHIEEEIIDLANFQAEVMRRKVLDIWTVGRG